MTGVGFQNFALNGKDKVVLLDNIGNMNSSIVNTVQDM